MQADVVVRKSEPQGMARGWILAEKTMQIIRAEGGEVMGVFDKLREKRRKRKIYDRLIEICVIESNLGAPYEFGLPPAYMYLEAGEYEQYFKDMETLNRNKLNKLRAKVVDEGHPSR